jgi:DNA-binding response OmpR family regulator
MLEREEGATSTLRQLGATVRTLDLWDDPVNLIADDDDDLGIRPRALVLEALDRPDLAIAALRAVRKEPFFDNVGAVIAVTVGQIARVEPSSGFDDFVLHPYVPEELYGRIRALEWRRSEFATEERHKVGGIVVDKAGHEVYVEGRPVQLTAKEFSLLAYLCERRGKVLSREHLLARVWGNRYEGGPRTVASAGEARTGVAARNASGQRLQAAHTGSGRQAEAGRRGGVIEPGRRRHGGQGRLEGPRRLHGAGA